MPREFVSNIVDKEPLSASARFAVGLLILQWIGPQLSAAEPVYPLTAAVGTEETVYVSDLRLPGLWQIRGGQGDVLFQAAAKFRTPLNAVRCVRVDRQGRVLACDSATREIYRFNDQGQPQGLTKGRIGIPMDIAETPEGELLVSDLETHRIWKVPAEGGEPVEFASIPAPRGIRLDAEGRLWVVSHGRNQVLRVSPDGSKQVVVTGRLFQFPHEILLQPEGAALVTDGYGKTVWRVPGDGEPARWIQGEPLRNPVGLCQLGDTVLIVDPHAKAVFQADAAGTLSVFWKGTGEIR